MAVSPTTSHSALSTPKDANPKEKFGWQPWLQPGLRRQLSLLFMGLMLIVLTLTSIAIMFIMHHSLVSNINRDLEDTYRQITGQNLQPAQAAATLNELDDNGDTPPLLINPQERNPSDNNLTLLRRNFPNYSIQIDWLSQDGAAMQTMVQQPASQQDELRFLHQALPQLRQMTGIDPNAPIQLSDSQLVNLLSAPDQALYLNVPIKAAFEKPVRFQLLVHVTEVQHRNAADGSLTTDTAIIYVGRSLQGTESTLNTLRNWLLFVGFLGVMLGSVLASWLAGKTLEPLLKVQKAAEQIDSESLSSRVPAPTQQGEVHSLARAINRMLERLEQSFETQRRFTSDASHELRTPITAIQGHAGYLLRRTELTQEQRNGLNIVYNESVRLTNMVQSLLELARSDSGVMQLQRGPVFTHMLLQDIARELKPIAQAQHAKLDVRGPDEVLEADSDRLKQVVINLVSNALKAGASLVIMESSTQPSDKNEDGVLLSVIDNGPGIAPEHLAKLFDRFYRVEESRSRDQGGAGLGLAIARSIVDAHGGRIWFESVVGQGTTVRVWLPRGDIALDDDIA